MRPTRGECGNDLAGSERQLGKPGKAPAWEAKSYGEVPVGPPTSRVAVGESQSLRVTWPLSTKGEG